MNRAILLGALVLFVGCGGSDHPGNVVVNTSEGGKSSTGGKSSKGGTAGSTSRGGSAGSAAKAGSAGSAGTAAKAGSAGKSNTGVGGSSAGASGDDGVAGTGTNPIAPIVVITSPVAAPDPSSENVLVQDLVDVTCLATAANVAGAKVDPTTVEIVLIQGGQIMQATGTPRRDPVTGTTATFSLEALKSDVVTFRCTASDGTSADMRGTATLSTLVDRGPTITFNAPANKENVALTTLVTVEFVVKPVRLPGIDTGADIDSTTGALTIDGKAIDVTATDIQPESVTYQTAPISLTDPPFSAGDYPSGVTVIQASAMNLRKASAIADMTITVDDQPPDITVISPKTGSIVAGEITLMFDVVDPMIGTDPGSGVVDSEVTVTVNENRFQYNPTDKNRWIHGIDNRFSFMFTEADLVGSKAQATIQIAAKDVAGNVNTGRVSLVLYLDSQAPLVDLDPPTLREVFADSGKVACSDAFDPLGEAVNDRAIRALPGTYRAFVWDMTNDPGPGLTQYLSSTDPASVSLWIQDDTRIPLLADVDLDGICDNIDPGTALSPARSVALAPVAPIGDAPKFRHPDDTAQLLDDTRFWKDAPPMDGICLVPQAAQTTAPTLLCNNYSDMLRVTKHAVATTTPTPAVYGLDPASSSVECTGRYWEMGVFADTDPSITDGWLCLAAKATDNVGNVGISRVLRVCYDNPNVPGRPACASDAYLLNVEAQLPGMNWVPATPTPPTRSNQYPAQPNCPCGVGQNYCVPLDTTKPAYCSAKKANCNGTDVANPCAFGQKRCVPRNSTELPYCIAAAQSCHADVDVTKVAIQCAVGQKLCVPRNSTAVAYCVTSTATCDPDVDVASAVVTPCASNERLCVPWNVSRTSYCLTRSRSCNSDVALDLSQCPSCPPTKYDVDTKKCTLELCTPADTTAGCKPENTIRCPCGPLCDAGSTTSPAGCTPYYPIPKNDPCAVPCRPPTNANPIRYVRLN